MVEIFEDIPVAIKQTIAQMIDTCFDSMDLKDAAKVIIDFSKDMPDKTRDFVDFYFNLKMEQLNDENNSNQR